MSFERISGFPDKEALILATNYLSILLLYLDRIPLQTNQFPSSAETPYPAIILKTISYLKNNFSKDLSLNQLAENVYVSPSYLCRSFKKFTKINIFEYLNTIRLNKSIELLQNTGKTISEIALETGFSSMNYFCQQFKKHLHISPYQYKKSLLSPPRNQKVY